MIDVIVRAQSREVRVVGKKNNEKSWPADYVCNFLEAGVVSYEDVGAGVALLKKEAIDRMLPSFIGKPVMINHKDVSPKDFQKKAVGYVTDAYFNPATGWFDCKFILIDDQAKALVEKGYSVSCSFKVLKTAQGGEWHAVRYDEEILEGEFEHLALVDSPRYEDCRIFVNSKAAVVKDNTSKGESMEKKENANLDILSPIQLDKYLDGMTDAGLAGLLENEEVSGAIKEAVKRHMGVREKDAAAEELGSGPGKKKEDAKVEDKKLNAEEAFVVVNGKEISVAELIRENEKLRNDFEEMRDPKLKDSKDGDKKEDVKNEDKKEDGNDDKKNDDKKEGDKKNEEIESKEEKEKELEIKKDDKKNEEKKEEIEPEKKLNEQKKVDHFVRLNSLKERAAELTETIVDTLHNKMQRGNSRYGSK